VVVPMPTFCDCAVPISNTNSNKKPIFFIFIF
jgi:hypothetical protein